MKTEWDLTHLYKSIQTCRQELANIALKAKEFKQNYEGLIAVKCKDVLSLDKALKELEELYETCSKLGAYAYLGFAKNSSANGAFMQEVSNELAKIEAELVFFEVEFCEFAPAFYDKSKYSYLLKCWLDNAQYNLSKECEELNARLSPLGASAFARFFDEYLGDIKFKLEGKLISEEELLSKLYSPDRALRKKAADAMSRALQRHLKPLVFVFNQIRNSKSIHDEIRGFSSPMSSRNISNQISDKSVEALIQSAEASFHLVHKYYRKKSEILGISKLFDYDRYAPLDAAFKVLSPAKSKIKEQNYNFNECVKLVKDCFAKFHPRFEQIFTDALASARVDVMPAANKRSGAFSYGVAPAPYAMLNHTDNRRDLFTLAHEMGHLIHQTLSIENQGYFYQHTPLTTAETASVFAEMLMFDELRKSLSEHERKALLASKIEDIFATFYRQINFTTFEKRLHEASGELSSDEISQIWLEESRKMFGDALTLRDSYKYWFSYVPHFIHSPFYCYSYSFAQLLVLALFGLYKSGECKDFKDRYVEFLAAGGSARPAELIASFGLDLESQSFWQLGIDQIAALVDEFCE